MLHTRTSVTMHILYSKPFSSFLQHVVFKGFQLSVRGRGREIYLFSAAHSAAVGST